MKDGCASQTVKNRRSIPLPVLKNAAHTAPAPKNDTRASSVSRWRAAALIALTLLMIAHVIQWRLTGKTVSPIEPSEAMHTLEKGAVNAGFVFFSLAILATLVFGRFVCGWGCHILALQDFCAWLLKKCGLVPKPFRSRLLVFVPLIVALYMFVYPTVYRFFAKPKHEPLIPQFTNHLITSEFWATFPPIFVAVPFLFICGFVTVYFLGQKGFCTYACPYGGFFRLADQLSPGKIRVNDNCNSCGHCTAVCTANVIVHREVKEYGMVVDQDCMKCMDCVSVCPTDALYFGWGKPAIAVKKTVKKNYSLTWAEEAAGATVFIVSFLAVWDVYQLVPMLMALGIAIVTTFLAVRSWQLFLAGNLSFYRFNLKSGNKIHEAGWAFLCFALVWVGLNAHSGYVRYHERAGAQAFENIKIPDELALAETKPARWLKAGDLENVHAGKKHLQTARKAGLFVNSYALPKLAWIEYLSGDADQAVRLLGESAAHQHGAAKALSFYYRGAILNRLGRCNEALSSLDQALAEAADLVVAREELGESLWQLKRQTEAVAAWRDAVTRNPNLPLANNLLAGALASDEQTARAYEQQADRFTPDDAYFHWMLGLRLQNVEMHRLAEKHFARAAELNPEFRARRSLDLKPERFGQQ